MAKRIIYPLYQLGNPQIRVFRTNYFLTLVRPGVPQMEDTVQFRIPMEMTRLELKDYLENIYNVPVATIRTRIQYGSNRQRDHKNRRIKKPDYKVAYVQLGAGQTFQFPDLYPERPETIEPGSLEDIQKKFMEDEMQRQKDDPKRSGVPSWFGL
ncbi:39S ribosomal protein L23, mitochondrial [Eublepharis macularius]|uniref:Large ribosomal subunit protein uL23m n=1 Tax=Eublepharis macularius TaxID=481883 RepID=A0AA97IZX2_EUBMA|nr:39S ribosomal protein L23, mitochondrial [Eublepharis macularius]